MRPQLSLSTAALACAALALATAGPAVAAAPSSHDTGRTLAPAEHTLPRVPPPDAATLTHRIDALDRADGVLAPVTRLLRTAVAAEHGRIPAADAARLVTAAKKAITAAKPAGAPATGTRAAAPADAVDDALAALGASVDALAASAATGDTATTSKAVSDALAHLVDVVVANAASGDLPQSELPDLPDLPALPVLPTTPGTQDPGTSTLPAPTTPSGISTLPVFAHPGLSDLSDLTR
ncbi:hypothetical protein [Streptomyces sp. NBC_01497]|uniref:hypothetical protein n=1 Tax=Streptomyces sp. NBC_01497 TaxID=2903885 RepID=UPI002E372C5F|nr:hypothetical protein [Streptomyces sp. NBC_01497]